MNNEQYQERRTDQKFLSSTALVMAAFVLSRVLGLVREALLGSAFGAGTDMDAFRAASRVTETLYVLVAGGALGSAFIPTFTAYLARGERKTAWQVASAVTNLVVLIATLAATAAFVVAPWLVSTALAPSYAPETQALTVSLLRWMLASTVIFSASGLLMGILNANDHFLLPALAPSLYNLGIIVGAVFLARWWGIYGVAAGTVLGALLHLLVQLPALRRLDGTYAPILGLRLAGVREVGRLMLPRVLGLAITQFQFWVNTNLGSRIPVAGVVSALTWGWQLMLLPQGIFAQAVATVAFPSFSAQAARGEKEALRSAIATVLGLVLFLALPAMVGLLILGRPLVEMLFMRGEFDQTAAAMVTWALAWYAVGLVAHSGLEIITRAFYALHDTATPVWVGGAAMALNIALSILFSHLFSKIGTAVLTSYQPWMPLGGLALANSVATTLEMLALTWLLRRRLSEMTGKQLAVSTTETAKSTGVVNLTIWASLWRTAASTAAMGAALWLFLAWMPTRHAWILGGGGMAIGAGTFLLAALLLKSPEIKWILRR